MRLRDIMPKSLFGRSLFMAFSSTVITSNTVPAPINLSLGFSILMKRVVYPNNHRRKVGMKVIRS